MRLNLEQERAANILEGNLVIIASAGTGKTTTIVERYFNLINKKNFLPEEILMTTFTNKSAKDMIKKIGKKTNKISPYIGTMHSLFLNILRKHPLESFDGKTFTLLTDVSDQKKIIREILKEENISTKNDAVIYFLNWISKFKNRGVFSKDLSLNGNLEETDEKNLISDVLDDEIIIIDPTWKIQVNKIYKKYQQYLLDNSILDFDEILLLTYKLFEKYPNILNNYKNKFKAIMVDEAQDLNVIQVKILEQLNNENLCLIGDDCQNIYEWRGSSNDLIFNFEKNEKKISLEKNYRSGENIIEVINKVINSMGKKIDKKITPTREKIKDLQINGYKNFSEEISETIDKVKKLIYMGEKPEEISILFRTNLIGKQLEKEFIRAGISCHLSKSISFFSREEIKDILSFLKLKINPYSKIDMERVLSLIGNFGKVKIQKFIKFLENNGFGLFEGIEKIEQINLENKIKEKLIYFGEICKEENFLDSFLEDFGYVSHIETKYMKDLDKIKEKKENVYFLRDLYYSSLKNDSSIEKFLDSLIDLDKKEKTDGKVILSTIHGAKGLEWKNVFLISCNEKILPFYKENISFRKRDAELRLFYVAISRAKDNLNISYSYFNNGRYLFPSQFLEIIYDSEFMLASEM